MDDYFRMSPFEVATGWVTGIDPPGPRPRPRDGVEGPVAALERVIEAALRQSPCLVEFSGGRDSSIVLALAVRVAAREALPPPVAITRVFRRSPESEEGAWQELVIRHLDVEHWVRQAFDDELDLVGPVVGTELRRHGLLWSPMVYSHQPSIQTAGGGVVLTGEGGDEVFGRRRVTPVTRLMRRVAPLDWPGIRSLVGALGPRPVRAGLARRRYRRLGLSWLRPAVLRELVAALAADTATEPLRWDRSVLCVPRVRAVRLLLHNLDVFAASGGARYCHPMHDPSFLAALGPIGGRAGFPSRTAALRELFGDLLPDEVLARETKAAFNTAMVGAHSREFIARWTGGGVDTDLVDPEALAEVWRQPSPHAMSFALLQSAWLAEQQHPEPVSSRGDPRPDMR